MVLKIRTIYTVLLISETRYVDDAVEVYSATPSHGSGGHGNITTPCTQSCLVYLQRLNVSSIPSGRLVHEGKWGSNLVICLTENSSY